MVLINDEIVPKDRMAILLRLGYPVTTTQRQWIADGPGTTVVVLVASRDSTTIVSKYLITQSMLTILMIICHQTFESLLIFAVNFRCTYSRCVALPTTPAEYMTRCASLLKSNCNAWQTTPRVIANRVNTYQESMEVCLINDNKLDVVAWP